MAGSRPPGPQCGEAQAIPFAGTAFPWMSRPSSNAGASNLFDSLLLPQPLWRVPDDPDVSFLFRLCLAPRQGLSDDDYEAAATALGIDVATIKAVAEVETPGKAFDPNGRPRILFERHYFHRLTGGRYDVGHAWISKKSSGGYGLFSVQYVKLEEAYGLDPTAALESASWGRFQIMGSNYRAAGYSSVRQFVEAMSRSEAAHLRAFVSFIDSDKAMKRSLQRGDWTAFAKAYNGSAYKKNRYDTLLKAAYERLSKRPPAPSPQGTTTTALIAPRG